MCGSERDAPRTCLQLQRKQFRSHCGLAVGRKSYSVGSDELLHPIQVVPQSFFIQNGRRQTQIFAQKVPVELCNFIGIDSSIEKAQPLVERSNRVQTGLLRRLTMIQRMNLQISAVRQRSFLEPRTSILYSEPAC